MKQIKNFAMLFIAILAMSSCSKEDNTSSPTQSLAQMLVGEWIMELPVSGLEAEPSSGIVIPDDADMLTLIFHFDADGYGWKELNVMRDYDEEGSNEELYFSGYTLTYDQDGIEFYLQRATDEQIQRYKKASDEWHGGSDEGSSIDTDIDNTDAGEPSRVSRLPR